MYLFFIKVVFSIWIHRCTLNMCIHTDARYMANIIISLLVDCVESSPRGCCFSKNDYQQVVAYSKQVDDKSLKIACMLYLPTVGLIGSAFARKCLYFCHT